MGLVKTARDLTVYTLDGNNHLGDIKSWEIDIQGKALKRQGMAATQAYTQNGGASARHAFEIVIDNSGPALQSTDIAVFDVGGDYLGDLQSGTFSLRIPTVDGSGVADFFEYANVSGARDVSLDAELFIPSATTLHALLAALDSDDPADKVFANVQVELGGALEFDYPMTLISGRHRGESEGAQVVSVHMEQRGTPTAAPSGTTLIGVAYGGNGLITLSDNSGAGTWAMVDAVVESLDFSWEKHGFTRGRGSLYARGKPGYS